jgi:hypothetical protein
MEFREFASIFVPRYRIPSIFLLWGTVRNRIPRVYCSAEQPEFCRNKPNVPSVSSSADYFFCQKLPTIGAQLTVLGVLEHKKRDVRIRIERLKSPGCYTAGGSVKIP